ncbi:hypothetical protein [Streptomyces sp. NPDC049970]|uniref:hypothetical protein n=1 Tax=Streptomyces sp. NPDC049970 TaxID=3155033 RepID=UPI00341604AE
MHSDIHSLLHAYRSTELHREVVEFTPGGRPPLRQRAGWVMIELGLRLTQAGPGPAHATRAA